MKRKTHKGPQDPILYKEGLRMKQSQKYAIHLDNLRQKRKMTVEELCFGVVDPRTYRRYKSGEKTLTHLKVVEFCKKLRISITDFYYSSEDKDTYGSQTIKNLFSLVRSRQYDQFYHDADKVHQSILYDIQNKRLIDYCYCRVHFETHKKSDDEIMLMLHEIVNYPESLNYEAFDFISLITLQLIAEIETKHLKIQALNKLIDILTKENMIYTSSETSTILPSIYTNTSILLVRLKKFEDAYHLSSKGIEFAFKTENMGGLTHLYYSKSISSLRLGNTLEAEKNAVLCILTAISRQNSYEIKTFREILKKEFSIDPLKLFTKYKDDFI